MNEYNKRLVSYRLKNLRIDHDYTMEQLAQKIGVAKSTVAKWENGYVENMRQSAIQKLANLYDVSPSYILGYDDESYYAGDRLKDIAQAIFENEQLGSLFDIARNSSNEDLKTIQTMLLALKKKEM